MYPLPVETGFTSPGYAHIAQRVPYFFHHPSDRVALGIKAATGKRADQDISGTIGQGVGEIQKLKRQGQ